MEDAGSCLTGSCTSSRTGSGYVGTPYTTATTSASRRVVRLWSSYRSGPLRGHTLDLSLFTLTLHGPEPTNPWDPLQE